jgi:hypothetical protein
VRTNKPKLTIAAALAVVLLAAGGLTLVLGDSADAAPALPGDGTTSATAGASCWGIKQQHPTSADGTYWLNTAALDRPQQFHCDMSTDGGGWVLVGRGREGWTFNPLGQGSAATVRETVSGPGAFAPATLATETIAALLNGTTVDALPDGVRLDRATNAAGTSRQRYVLFPKARAWTWNLGSGQLLNKVVIDGSTYNGSNTYDTKDSVTGQTTNGLSGAQGTRRMWTWAWSSHQSKRGFAFGTGVNGGSSSATNHLWTAGSEGSPLPFTQVWIRPRIANDAAGFSPIPAAGFTAQAEPTALKNRSELAPWGVEGMNHANEVTIEPWNTNVLAIESHGDRTFVGGRFLTVRNGPGGAATSQPSLAAFDLDGNWISSFRPSIAGRVWDMVVTAEGRLVIAGDFTSVNGAPNTSGMAALDPTTGEVVAGWKASATTTSGRALVRTLDLRDGTIYAAGDFNRYTGGIWNTITVSRAISLRASDGTPGSWRPRATGQIVDLQLSDDSSRVLMGGYFNNINGDTNHGYFAVTDAATGNPVAGIGRWSPSHTSGFYQQAVNDLGDGRIAVGGSQHNIQLWDWNRTSMLDAKITKSGGDTQVFEEIGDRVYFGCHCGNWIYQGTNSFSSPSGFRSVDPVNLVGAIDSATWEYDTTWYPSSLKGPRGEGVWAIDEDERGCVWVGGDLNRGAYSGSAATDWLGGFARFCPADATPPSAPTNLRGAAAGTSVELQWTGSTDASGTVSYDVYRDDRPIATVWGTTFTDPAPAASARYTVRASDARGNRSASPAPITIDGPAPVISTAVAFGATWRYRADGVDQGTAWRSTDFDDAAWAAGPAKIGWGTAGLATSVGNAKPLTSYYRTSFDLADATSVELLDVRLTTATGAVVYVNGIEAGRINMPAGAVGATTPAAAYVSGSAEAAIHTIAVPGSVLRSGRNVVAVEVHNVTAGGSRAFLDLEATALGANVDATAPSASSLTAAATASVVNLTWTAATDDVALGGYVLSRDGEPRAVVGPLATSFVDGEVDLAVEHRYTVTAFDRNGNATASNEVRTGVAVDPNLLPYGATWRWSYTEGGPAAGWQNDGFDDAGWASGPGELGYGDSDEKTIISTAPTPRPLTAYFRTTVTVDNPGAFTAVLADLVRDDGAVLYVNGVEVGRDNLPAGPIAFATPAVRVISTRAEERAPVRFTIPASAFRAGTNTIAVEVHNTDRWSGDLSLDLKLTGQP